MDAFDEVSGDPRDQVVRERWIRERDAWRTEAMELRKEREREIRDLKLAASELRAVAERLLAKVDKK